jgi:hypothetical protein
LQGGGKGRVPESFIGEGGDCHVARRASNRGCRLLGAHRLLQAVPVSHDSVYWLLLCASVCAAGAAAFANTKLQRSGRCHESEVFSAFRRTSGRYRSAEVLPDSTLRDMVRNWHPGVERTRTGYLKNVSLQGSEDRLKSRAAPAAAPADTVDSREVSSGSDLLDSIAQAAAVSSTDESSTEAGSAVEEPVQTH